MAFDWRAHRHKKKDRATGARTMAPRRLVAALGALGLVAGGMLAAGPAFAAPGDPFNPASPVVYVAQGTPTVLYQATTDGTGSTSFEAVGGASGVNYNAIAYNTADNYIYGIGSGSGIPANSLVRVGQDGVVTRVGTATYAPSVSATFGPDGLFYSYANVNGTPAVQVVNVATGAILRNTPITGQLAVGNDIAFNGGFLWTMGGGFFSRTNPATGATVRFAIPFATDTTDQGGAAWTYGNGNLGFSYNVSGTVYQIAVANPASATPTFTLVSTNPGPASASNDGTSAPGLPTDLAIVKTGPTSFVAGSTVTYTLTVTNNGPGNSSGYVINDSVPAPLTGVTSPDEACTVTGNAVSCVGGVLANGDSASFTVTASVPAGTTAAVGNTATVTPNEEDPTPGNNTSTVTSAPAGIAVVKNAATPVDVNENGIVDVGDTIQYTFAVTNSGQVALSGISVDDPKVGTVLCPQPTLAPGASQTCAAAAAYVITQADVDNGSVDNTATASGTTPDGQTATSSPSTTSTPTTAAAPRLTVVKSADPADADSYEAGQVITYSFVVTNTGNVPMNDITIVEGSFSGTGQVSDVACPEDSLAAGEQVVCTASYTLTQADVDAGELTNTATAEGTPPGETTPVPSDPSTVTVPSIADPSLTVVKSASADAIVEAGQQLTYSFLVRNTGNVTLDGIVIDDTEFSGTGELSTVVCPTDTLVPGQFTTCTAEYTVEQADVDAGELTNAAFASGSTPDGGTVPSDPSRVSTPVAQTPALSVAKTADVVAAEVGQTVTYSFLITNTGNVTITDPAVNEVAFSGTGELSAIVCPDEVSLAPGEDVTCTATYVVTQADVDSGRISNTATVTGTTPGGDPTDPSEPSENVVTTDPLAAISVLKTADAEEVTKAGQVVTYSFLVTNTGNVTLTDPAVQEGAFSGNGELSAVTCPEGDLAPGASITCTATYTVVATDLADGGELTNTATASATTPSGDPITSAPSTAVIDEVAPPVPPITGGGLAITGGVIAWSAAGTALLLIVAGGVMVFARRRNGNAEA